MTPLRDITEPTEKSNPPETNAKVIPTVIIPSADKPIAVDIKFSLVRKCGGRIHNENSGCKKQKFVTHNTLDVFNENYVSLHRMCTFLKNILNFNCELATDLRKSLLFFVRQNHTKK